MAYMDYTLKDLPKDVRDLAIAAVRTLAERGPHGLVEDGLCPPEAEKVLAVNRSDYAGNLIEMPESAELDFHVDDGIWKIDLPLHDDQEGRIDLFIFLEIDPRVRSVKVTGLYTP
jgi:hypothetical protein